jgi:hypothetical protein
MELRLAWRFAISAFANFLTPPPPGPSPVSLDGNSWAWKPNCDRDGSIVGRLLGDLLTSIREVVTGDDHGRALFRERYF